MDEANEVVEDVDLITSFFCTVFLACWGTLFLILLCYVDERGIQWSKIRATTEMFVLFFLLQVFVDFSMRTNQKFMTRKVFLF